MLVKKRQAERERERFREYIYRKETMKTEALVNENLYEIKLLC